MSEITARTAIHINLGNFEWVEVDRTITGIPGATPAEEIDARLYRLMAGGIKKAIAATLYDEADNETSVYEWNKLIGGADA